MERGCQQNDSLSSMAIPHLGLVVSVLFEHVRELSPTCDARGLTSEHLRVALRGKSTQARQGHSRVSFLPRPPPQHTHISPPPPHHQVPRGPTTPLPPPAPRPAPPSAEGPRGLAQGMARAPLQYELTAALQAPPPVAGTPPRRNPHPAGRPFDGTGVVGPGAAVRYVAGGTAGVQQLLSCKLESCRLKRRTL